MEVFGIIGMSLGTMGFVFGIICLNQMGKLIKTLKEKKILEEDYKNVDTSKVAIAISPIL